MSLTTFPFETDEPAADVLLPLGNHRLKLIVVDDAGTQSQADTVAINVLRSPAPSIESMMPDRVVKGATVDAVVFGESLTGVTSIKVYRDANEDDRIKVTVREGGTDDRLPISIAVTDYAHAGVRTLAVTTGGGTATASFKVLSSEGVQIRAVTPQGGTVGHRKPIAVRIDGDNLEEVTEVSFLRRQHSDAAIKTSVQATQPDYVDTDVSISVNAAFGPRTIFVQTPVNDAHSAPGVVFRVLPGLLQYAIMALTLITAVVHITLNFPDPLFILNGLGYIALLVALYVPFYEPITQRRRLVRWVLLAYALLTIVIWLAIGGHSTLAYLTKTVEAVLVLLLLWESQQP